jgi:protein arginine kinase activator
MQAPCQLCGKKEATIHLTELDPSGGPRELHICAACSQSLGMPLEDGPPAITTLLEKVSGEKPAAAATASAEAEAEAPCPMCGLTFGEYSANNLFGCAHDYLSFAEQLEPVLSRYHGSIRHTGRHPLSTPEPAPQAMLPAAAAAPPSPESERKQLETALKQAVARERYEDAARLRDRLRQLDQGEVP